MPLIVATLLALAPVPQGEAEKSARLEPSRTPVSWELDFRFNDPQRIEIRLPDSDEPVTYWYMLYTVTNPDRQSRRFHPTIELVTDDLRVIGTDFGISPLVFDAIKERHKQTHPYLVSPTKASGTLLTGDDYARESVAIWRAKDITGEHFSVYVAGLSGETRLIANPSYDPDVETRTETDSDGHEQIVNPRYFTLRKTLEIRYDLLGSKDARQTAKPERQDSRWIMR